MGKNKIVVESIEPEKSPDTPADPEQVSEEPVIVDDGCAPDPEPVPDDMISVEDVPKTKRKATAKDVVPQPPTTPAPKSRGRPKKEIKPVEVEEVKQVEEVKSDDDAKAVKKSEKIKCEDCGKMVSAKTLKYTHKANCKAKKCDVVSVPKEEHVHSAPKEEPKSSPVPAPIETPVCRRQTERSIRMQKRQELLASLASEAF